MQRDDFNATVEMAAARAADHQAAAEELRRQEQCLKTAQEREKQARDAMLKAREQLLQAAAEEMARLAEMSTPKLAAKPAA